MRVLAGVLSLRASHAGTDGFDRPHQTPPTGAPARRRGHSTSCHRSRSGRATQGHRAAVRRLPVPLAPWHNAPSQATPEAAVGSSVPSSPRCPQRPSSSSRRLSAYSSGNSSRNLTRTCPETIPLPGSGICRATSGTTLVLISSRDFFTRRLTWMI